MKRVVFAVVFVLSVLPVGAQESQTVYNFLRLPVSAHVAALGGDNTTLVEDDATLIFHNPALINNVTDRTLNLNLMTYMEGATTGSASFLRAAGERGTWGVTGQFMSYGTMKETNVSGQQTGDFSAKDIALGGTFAYALSERFSGGITAKLVASYIGQYNSLGAAVDLGLNYYDAEREWSLSAVARNLGGQLSAYEDDFERLPLDLQVGVTKRLTFLGYAGAPQRLALRHWQTPRGRCRPAAVAAVLCGRRL